ncbi:MAG: DNA-protecting protein DprA [Nitrososphaerota archaeon]|jgi:DNA processing protein|nr:DNA-protecting protein DprA [Nitrososphaerota archaeon]
MNVSEKGSSQVSRKGVQPGVTPEELLGPLNQLERKFAPPKLFLSGAMSLPLPHPKVAVIGTRQPSEEGVKIAHDLASSLASQGVTVISGLARGIDTAAHTAAIEADGKTIAVLGTPLSHAYPKENEDLQKRIMQGFLAISQFAEGQPTRPRNFVLRDRTMALIADASVIVESGDGGGTLYQGWEALRLGRPLFIHAREFQKPALKWPTKMAEYGAIEFKEPSDVIESVPSVSFNRVIVDALNIA